MPAERNQWPDRMEASLATKDYSLAGPVLPTIAGGAGWSTLVIGVVRAAGRWDEDDPVDSPTAQGHQRATATGPGPTDLPTPLGSPLERSRSDPSGGRRPPGSLGPPGRPVAPDLPQQGAGSTLHPALPGRSGPPRPGPGRADQARD